MNLCHGCDHHIDIRPKMVDVCCCAGGTSVGYHRAGFCVTGVDVNPQPRYPFRFVQADALAYLDAHLCEFAVGAGSPPCQNDTPLNAYNKREYPRLIGPVRDRFLAAGIPYVIENVPGARPLLRDPIELCGTMFDLPVYRHRLFELGGFNGEPPRPCDGGRRDHAWLCSRNGYLPTAERPFMSIHGGRHSKAWQSAACEAMGLGHLDVRTSGASTKVAIREICEAIPPAMTEYIGQELLRHLMFVKSGGVA